MEFSINQNTLQQAVTKIKSSLQSPAFIKIKAGKTLVIASSHEGYSIVIKISDYKLKKEGTATLDFETFVQIIKGTGEITFNCDENQIHFSHGRCKGSINLLEEIKFEHKTLENTFELDDQSTVLFDFLDMLTLKDIKFGQDDAPICIDLSPKILELSSATHSEAVVIDKQLKTKSKLSTTLSPRVLKRVKALVGKSSYKIALTDSTLFVEFSDKVLNLSFSSPLLELAPTSTASIKHLRSKELDACENFITIDSSELLNYFSKLKPIAEPNNAVEMTISKKGLELIFTTSKGKIEDLIKPAFKKLKTSKTTFLIDYDLMINNLSKMKDKITLSFCDRSLWINAETPDYKLNIMVALL